MILYNLPVWTSIFFFFFYFSILPTPSNKPIPPIRVSLFYKSILNLNDIKYITQLTKNKSVLAKIFTNRKITKAGRIYLKKILLENLDITKLANEEKFWSKIVPYLKKEEMESLIKRLSTAPLKLQLFILEQIINNFCHTFDNSLLNYMFSEYYQYSNFHEIISKCNNDKLLNLYSKFLVTEKISIRTYLYLVSEHPFETMKKSLYEIMPKLPARTLPIIFSQYPNIINTTTQNLYKKVILNQITSRKKRYKIPPYKINGSNRYTLLKNIIGNIHNTKDLRKIVKLNTDFFIFSYLIKKYPQYLPYIYKENFKNEIFRYKIFINMVILKQLHNFHLLNSFYKHYEIYTYLVKLKTHKEEFRYACKKTRILFDGQHRKLWTKICKKI